MKRAVRRFLLALAAAASIGAAHAGRSCEERPLSKAALEQGMQLAERVAAKMDASGAQVIVIARAGQDLGRHGLRWSHLGLAYRSAEGWRIVHKLNHCGSDTAALYRQGLGQFFLDDPWRYEAALVPLAPELQGRVAELLQDDRRAAALDTPAYNMLAYPWSQRYQQSNQWAIETLAMALEPDAVTRERAQAWLKLKGYEPTTLQLGPLTRLGARITRANVAFDDHPNARRFSDRIDTVSADSVFAWLQRSGLGGAMQVVE